jgi:hypothetical protein
VRSQLSQNSLEVSVSFLDESDSSHNLLANVSWHIYRVLFYGSIVSDTIHVLNPLEAWNASRSIASQVVSAIEHAEDVASDPLPYDPYVLKQELTESEPPVENLWPRAAREVLFFELQTIRQEQDSDLTYELSNTVMDLLKDEGQLMVVNEEKKDKLTAADYDPHQLSHWTEARTKSVAVAIKLVQTYNDSSGSYKDIVTSDPLLEDARPASARVELVNSSMKTVVDQILYIAEWVDSINQESSTGDSLDKHQPRKPMGYNSSLTSSHS